jgi:hypothetical protein
MLWPGLRLAPAETANVSNQLERTAEHASIHDELARRGVRHRELHFAIGQAGRKDPVRARDGAGVEDLDHELYVGVVEEPEVARVCREGLGLTGAAARIACLGAVGPGGLDGEAVAVQAQLGGGSLTGRSAHGRGIDFKARCSGGARHGHQPMPGPTG